MSEGRPDRAIDLHKLAAQNGEGLAPILSALFDRSRDFRDDVANVANVAESPRARSAEAFAPAPMQAEAG